MIREHRGDGHVLALVDAGLDACEALVTAAAAAAETGGAGRDVLQMTRGWTDDEWAAAAERLSRRGLVDEMGALTQPGRQLRQQIEDRTDQLSLPLLEVIGEEKASRLTELGRPIARAVGEAGGIPWPNPMGVGRP